MMKLNKVIPSNYKFVSSIKNDKKIVSKKYLKILKFSIKVTKNRFKN